MYTLTDTDVEGDTESANSIGTFCESECVELWLTSTLIFDDELYSFRSRERGHSECVVRCCAHPFKGGRSVLQFDVFGVLIRCLGSFNVDLHSISVRRCTDRHKKGLPICILLISHCRNLDHEE